MRIPTWIYADCSVENRSGIEAMLQNKDLKVVELDKRVWST